MTVPSLRKAGFRPASFSAVVSGLGCSSRSSPPAGTSSSEKSAAAQRCCERKANASWSSRETLQRSATFSPVSPIDSSGNFASIAGFGKRQPRVESYIVRSPRGKAASGFAVTSGARLIDSTPPATNRSPSPAAIAWQAPTTAERPDAQSRFTRHARNRVGQPGQQRRHPGDVAVVLARLVRAAEVDVLDLRRVDAGSLHRRGHCDRRQVVRTHACQAASVPPDRRPHRGEHDGATHAGGSSARTSWATANAELAAGTPQ